MFSPLFSRQMRAMTTLSFAVVLGLGASQATAQEIDFDHCGPDIEQSATISASGGSVGFMIGYRWGKGVLKLDDGREYPFSVRGMKILETGGRAIEVEGEVYNLKRLQDFIGHYYGGSIGVTLAKGTGEVQMNNAACVVIVARSKSEGLQLSAPGAAGVTIQFADE